MSIPNYLLVSALEGSEEMQRYTVMSGQIINEECRELEERYGPPPWPNDREISLKYGNRDAAALRTIIGDERFLRAQERAIEVLRKP